MTEAIHTTTCNAVDGSGSGECSCGAESAARARTKSNPFDPDTLSSSLAIRPDDVRAHVAMERSKAEREISPASARQQASLDRIGKLAGYDNRSRSQIRTYVLGYDPGAGEELTAAVLMERQPDGSHRVVGVRTWTRPDGRSPEERPALYEMIVKGWRCLACGVFVSEEKELMETCRSCVAHRPTPTS